MNTKGLLHILAIAALCVASASCSPSAYVTRMETRQPSTSGLSLYGKNLAVVYLESKDGSDSLLNNRISDALALNLEMDFFDSQEAIPVFRVPKDDNGLYSSKDTLASYIMDLDCDVIMMLDTPEVQGPVSQRSYSSKLYIYDSMWEKDDVVVLNSTYRLPENDIEAKALSVGSSLADPLRSEWKTEDFTYVYFDDLSSGWIEALEAVDEGELDKSISLWMKLAKSRSSIQRACAMYNISMACYLLGEYELAEEWLDRADENYPISLSPGMRKRIETALHKS